MITIATLWIAAIMVLLLFLARSVRTVHRTLRCPMRGRDVEVRFLQAEPEGRPIEVTACSEFWPTSAITCDRRCLSLLGPRQGGLLRARPEIGLSAAPGARSA